MSEVWLSLKKSFPCRPHSSEVHDPKANGHNRSSQRKKKGKIESSNAKEFNHGSNDSQSSSRKSKASSAVLNPITHEIVLDSTSGVVKICLCYPYPQSNIPDDDRGFEGDHGKTHRSTKPTTPSRKTHVDCDECHIFSKPKVLVKKSSKDPPKLNRHHGCGGKQNSLETIEEEHDNPEHSVIELHKGDSSWQIIEQICQTSCNVNSESKEVKIESILKVQNMQKTFATFEEFREMVKNNASKLQNKHPRCLADGNELLRFHGTSIACFLGINGSSTTLCTSDQCGVCQILRQGFSTNKEFHGAFGVFTTSTGGQAFASIDSSDEKPNQRKCVIVCRVIAGRVHNPLEEIQTIDDSSGSDSLAGKISYQSDIEELYVLNPKAILPCFVVVYKL